MIFKIIVSSFVAYRTVKNVYRKLNEEPIRTIHVYKVKSPISATK